MRTWTEKEKIKHFSLDFLKKFCSAAISSLGRGTCGIHQGDGQGSQKPWSRKQQILLHLSRIQPHMPTLPYNLNSPLLFYFCLSRVCVCLDSTSRPSVDCWINTFLVVYNIIYLALDCVRGRTEYDTWLLYIID